MRKTPAPLPAQLAFAETAAVNTAPVKPAVETVFAKTAPAKQGGPKTPAPKMPAAKMPAPRPAAAKPAAIVAETPTNSFSGAAGRAWRMSGKHAVAYVHTATLAGELLATEPRQVAGSAMAVYYDRKGRPFAWQFRFDSARWSEVVGRLA